MKFSLCFGAALLLASSLFATEIKPVDPGAPVFRIYLAFKSPSQQRTKPGPRVTFDSKLPLLVVSSARDVRLGRNGKEVVFTLNEKDTAAFAAISRKYNHGLLLVEGQGRVLSAMQITEPLNNGVFEFNDRDDADVVKYLRRRFKLGESR